ncbi:MAG TPA: hypothetical protein VKZ58_10160 [Longimicrobiales bacterium]|nr:hypothetical protein [Longimicrobiales bacterium]
MRSDGLTAGARQRGGRRLPVVGSRGRGGIGLSGSRVASIDGQRARGWLAAALFVALLALPGPARAQIGFGPFLGPSFPVADLADAVSTGYHGGLALDVGIPFAPIGARADLTFQYMPGKDGADDFFQLFATASARLRFVPAAVFSLHLLGGAGLYGSSFDRDLEDGEYTVDFGVNGGLGARIGIFGIRPFIEARYHYVFSDPGRAFIPISIGFVF